MGKWLDEAKKGWRQADIEREASRKKGEAKKEQKRHATLAKLIKQSKLKKERQALRERKYERSMAKKEAEEAKRKRETALRITRANRERELLRAQARAKAAKLHKMRIEEYIRRRRSNAFKSIFGTSKKRR
jgi:hypothetical protein